MLSKRFELTIHLVVMEQDVDDGSIVECLSELSRCVVGSHGIEVSEPLRLSESGIEYS